MSIEIRLKQKYREHKPPGKFRADYAGNSGRRLRGTPPVGLRKRPRGKTRSSGSMFGHV